MSTSGTYGKRSRVAEKETGIRLVAPTYGRSRIRTYGGKSGDIVIESQAERFIAHMLSVDPRVTRFRPQPFTIDLNGQRLLTSKEQVKEVLDRYSQKTGPRIYTPDFGIDFTAAKQAALEVKTDAYPGDTHYQERLTRAGTVLTAYGYELVKVVLPQVFNGPLKQNLQLLQQAKRIKNCTLSAEMLEQLYRLESRTLTLGEVCQHLCLPLNFAPALVLTGAISFDIRHHPFHAETPVELAYGELEHLQLIRRLV